MLPWATTMVPLASAGIRSWYSAVVPLTRSEAVTEPFATSEAAGPDATMMYVALPGVLCVTENETAQVYAPALLGRESGWDEDGRV